MKTAVITGATSGIGLCFAMEYAKRGYRLILTGRNQKRLAEIVTRLQASYAIRAEGYPYDLDREEDVKEFAAKLYDISVDCLINNAGFGCCGPFTATDCEEELSMIRVNVSAAHYLFKTVLRKMQTQGYGTICNVASSAGLLPGGPYMATYYATKAYLVSLTRAVRQELKEAGSPVFVCALCPGPVDTGFNDRAHVSFALKGISAEYCVREALRGMEKKRAIIVPGRLPAIGMKLQRLLPVAVLLTMTGRQQKRKFIE